MRSKLGWGLVWGALCISCFVHSRQATAASCALYARAVTGVDLHGDAGVWWDEAAGRYQRGQAPAVGSILVFRPTGRIPYGHVAVVSKIVDSSMVLVDQSNWSHGRVTLGTPVADMSPNHDWTMVAVMDRGSGQLGGNYPTFGFVYPQSGLRPFAGTVNTASFDPSIAAGRASAISDYPRAMFHFAVGDTYQTNSAAAIAPGTSR
jgi:hypothetical protein